MGNIWLFIYFSRLLLQPEEVVVRFDETNLDDDGVDLKFSLVFATRT